MKIKQKQSIVVFEVIDNDQIKTVETKAGEKYHDLIVDFLNSIGFNVTHMYPNSKTSILINGVEMEFDFNSASYAGRSSFTKKCEPRKNRHIKISAYYFDDKSVHIPINKEMDKEKVFKRLLKLVNDKKELIYKRECKEQAQIDLGLKLVNHIKSNHILSKAVTGLNIYNTCFTVNASCGKITFNLNTWKFNSFSPKEISFKTIEDILVAPNIAKVISEYSLKYINELHKIGNCLSPEEIELTKEMNHNPEFSKN